MLWNVFGMATMTAPRANRTARPKADAGVSPVLRFEAKLVQQAKTRDAPAGVVVIVPPAIAKQMAGVTLAEGTINGHPFRGEVVKTESGTLAVRTNAAMLKGARTNVGDTAVLAILGPEPKLTVPNDLRDAFAAAADAASLFTSLPSHVQRDWVRWIDGTNVAETRARRITRTVEQLAEGKRRPCCVNFYEYSLARLSLDDIKPETRRFVKRTSEAE